MNRVAKVLIAVSVTLVISGCTMPYGKPKLMASDGTTTRIDGVRKMLTDQESSSAEVDVIAVHGMCTHNHKWATETIQTLADQLGGRPESEIRTLTVTNSLAVLYKQTVTLPNGRVNISALVWSPVLKPLKEQLCYDMSEKVGVCGNTEPYEESRAWINSKAKDILMDDCLADAMAYQGKAKPEISLQVQEAFLAAVLPDKFPLNASVVRERATSRTTPLVVITESLGSKIGFDAIDALSESKSVDDKAAVDATFLRIRQIYMAANQIPILQLSDQTLAEALKGPAAMALTPEGEPADPLARLIRHYHGEKAPFTLEGLVKETGAPLVVALSDPNDILSYSLRNSPTRPHYLTLDVVASNANTYFWLFENPYKAHTKYLLQPGIVNLIIEGSEPR